MTGGKIRGLRFHKLKPKLVTCTRCNGFGGHFDGCDVQACGYCCGLGEVPTP